MKIVHKLILLILVGFFGCVSISTIGFLRLSDSNRDMRGFIDNTLPSFNILNTTNINFLQLRLMMRAHVLSTDLNEKQQLEGKILKKEELWR